MAQEVSSNKSFGGIQKVYSHESKVLGCSMKFAVYVPPGEGPFPVLWFLSGLTCTEANCVQKGSFQQSASSQGVVVICPDTSPRGIDIEGDNDSWDFGTGAGFYVNATETKWKPYRMYEYVTEELPSVCAALLGDKANMAKQSITGHSMGGHGALICAMKNPSKYQSVSAFSPICAPMNCPWGQKAFTGYLGEDKSTWEAYDASKLAEKYSGPKLKVLIDQGSVDDFLIKGQLLPEQFVAAALKNDNLEVEYRLQEGYDHSYFFISSFMKDHIEFHAKNMSNHVTGYAEWQEFVKNNDGKEIFALFCGGKDENGKSWCPDCVTAEPVVHGELNKLPEGAVFVHVDVGGRTYWKNKENDFRVDPKLKLSGVPTLLKYGEKNKLVEDQLFKPDLIRMLFEEE